jgi:phage/plasmid-like protein (TIGR03299 family)
MARINEDPVEIVKDDVIVRHILLSNSHDGSLAVRCGFSGVRLVCMNAISYAYNSPASKLLRIRHTRRVHEALETVQSVMGVANREFEATVEQMKTLTRCGVDTKTIEKYVRRVFKPQVVKGGNEDDNAAKRLVGKIIPLIEEEERILPSIRGTMWAAYNGVTRYLSHHRGRTQDNRVDSQWFGDSAKVGGQALQVATRMAMVA